MRFDHSNAAGAKVFDVDTKEELTEVAWVDLYTEEVCRFKKPYRAMVDGAESFIERYTTIYAIYGGSTKPVLFHCYGKR